MEVNNGCKRLSSGELALGFGVLIFLFFAFGTIFYLTAIGKIKQGSSRTRVGVRRGSGPTFSVSI